MPLPESAARGLNPPIASSNWPAGGPCLQVQRLFALLRLLRTNTRLFLVYAISFRAGVRDDFRRSWRGNVYFAHSTSNPDVSDWQPLPAHLTSVADLAEQFGLKIGIGNAARLAGLLHDLGKYTPEFQARLMGSTRPADHSTAGASQVIGLARGNDRIIAELIAYGGVDRNHAVGLYGDVNAAVAPSCGAWIELVCAITTTAVRVVAPSCRVRIETASASLAAVSAVAPRAGAVWLPIGVAKVATDRGIDARREDNERGRSSEHPGQPVSSSLEA
jgi:hypothetical protein